MACVLGQVQETGCDYIVLAQRKNTDSSKKKTLKSDMLILSQQLQDEYEYI
jgi:hypothetical protein